MKKPSIKGLRIALGLALSLAFPSMAHAGLISDLSSGISSIEGAILQVESQIGGSLNTSNIVGILQTGKTVNTGQNQQMSANLKEMNQKLQEQSTSLEQQAAAKAAAQYAWQTNGVSEPLGCTAPVAASGNLMASLGQSTQAASQTYNTGGFVGGNGAFVGETLAPDNQQQIANLSNQTGNQNNAQSLFSASQSGDQSTVEKTLLDPITPQALPNTTAETPSGTQYLAAWNKNSAALSLAAAGLGTVGSLHTFTVPQSAVNSTASTAGTSSVATKAAVSKPVVKAPNATKSSTPSAPSSDSGQWRNLVPKYANLVAQIAAAHNIPPAVLATIMAHEDGSENLQALTFCGTINSPRAERTTAANGEPTVVCPTPSHGKIIGMSAKSLTQMIDSTAAGNGLTDPLEGTTSATAELNAAAHGIEAGSAACHGNVPCIFDYWYSGKAYPNDNFSGAGMVANQQSQASYVQQIMSMYTGPDKYAVDMYNGGSGGMDTGSSANGSGASSAGLLRISSYGSYANPAWYTKLNSSPLTGVLRSLAYLTALQNVVANQNRQIMEHLDAVMAERLALSQQAKDAKLNDLRGDAMEQYDNEPFWKKIAQHL